MGLGSEMVTAWRCQIQDSYLNRRISEIEGADSWIALRLGRNRTWLFLSWDHSCYGCCSCSAEQVRTLSSTSKSRPPLLAALKKHLSGATLTGISQINRDRVLSFRFSKRLGAGRDLVTGLILEAADRFSNLILTDSDDVVMETAHHVHPDVNRYRSVLPGQRYVPPPPFPGKDLDDLPDAFQPGLAKELRGIGKRLARTLKELWEPGDTSWKEPLRQILTPQTDGPPQCQALGGYITIWPVLLPGASPLKGNPLEASAAGVIDPLVATKVKRVRKQIGKEIGDELHRVDRRLSGMRERLSRGEKADLWNHEGELLLAYPHLVSKNSCRASIPDWESGKDLVIEVDPDLDAVGNAREYFERAKKARSHVKEARAEAQELEIKCEELRTDLALIDKMEDPEALAQFGRDRLPHKERANRKRGGKKETPSHLRYDLDQCVLLVGLSARGNRYVTFDLASPDDIWFHVQGIPGSHVILKAPFQEIPENVFLAAASLAAYYSRSDNAGDLVVDYTERRHVRHIRGSGPANVTFKNSSSIRIDQNLWRKVLQEEPSGLREEDS